MLDWESEISEIVGDSLEIFDDRSFASSDMRDTIRCESTFDDLVSRDHRECEDCGIHKKKNNE